MERKRAQIDADELVHFTRKLIQTPSPSGEEDTVAELTAREMHRLGFDRVYVDELNNVIGHINPQGSPLVMLNGHLDHAEIGDMCEPFSGAIVEGEHYGRAEPVIRGRGACDMKGAVAAMIHAAAAFARRNGDPRGGVVVTAVTLEEKGEGDGTRHVLDQGVTADFAVCGEATNLRVSTGHRGKFNVQITTRGETAHACDPDRGRNAITDMHLFLTHLQSSYRLPEHELLGRCTCTPVDIWAQPGANSPVIPDRCSVILDRRTLPGETARGVIAEIQSIIETIRVEHPAFRAGVEIVTRTSPLLLKPDEPVVTRVREARDQVMGCGAPLTSWRFGTDAPYINQRGIPCAGLGPGDETFAHTNDDHLAIDDLLLSAKIYARLLENNCL